MRYQIGRFIVHGDGSQAVGKSSALQTGCAVPETGIYRVLHPQHQLPGEVTLIRNQPFPRCSKCPEPVCFELVRSAPAIGANPRGFSVTLYELPELAEADGSLAG